MKYRLYEEGFLTGLLTGMVLSAFLFNISSCSTASGVGSVAAKGTVNELVCDSRCLKSTNKKVDYLEKKYQEIHDKLVRLETRFEKDDHGDDRLDELQARDIADIKRSLRMLSRNGKIEKKGGL